MTLKEAIASLKKDAEHVAMDTAEAELSDIAKRFIEAVEIVTAAAESPRPGWTPCAEGLPEKGEVVLISMRAPGYDTVSIYVASRDMLGDGWVDRYGECIEPYYTVIAWQPLPAPHNPDRKEDADHIVDANKKIEPPYRADQKEDAEKKDSEPKKESHNPQECRNCTVDHDHHKSYLVCEKKHGGIDRDPSVCDGCADFKRR